MDKAVPELLLIWMNFGPTHLDRLRALQARYEGRVEVRGIELFGGSAVYAWTQEDKKSSGVTTLFPGASEGEVPWFRVALALVRIIIGLRRRSIVLFCHYERVEIFIAAAFSRLRKLRVILMNDSKFNDYRRLWYRELIKVAMHLPYQGALAGSPESKEYMAFLGIDADRVEVGYDVVSGSRLRQAAGLGSVESGFDAGSRGGFIVVARLVEKKNFDLLLAGYLKYVKSVNSPLPLRILGNGPLEVVIRADIVRLGLDELVHLDGFVQTSEVALSIARARALLLLSTEEQFGLVVAESILLNTPVIVSDAVGSRSLLVRNGVNGFVVEVDGVDGVATAMKRLHQDEDCWIHMSAACNQFRPFADVSFFADAVDKLVVVH